MMILKSELASNEKSSAGWREDTIGGCRWEKLHYHDLPVSWTCGNCGNSGDSIKMWSGQWEKRRENCKVWIHQRDPEGIASCTCIYLERSLFIVFQSFEELGDMCHNLKLYELGGWAVWGVFLPWIKTILFDRRCARLPQLSHCSIFEIIKLATTLWLDFFRSRG